MSQKMLFSGGSLQQAILAAARHFGLEADVVAYHVREQRQGIVRGRQRIVIEVDPAAPRVVAREIPAPAPPPRPVAAPQPRASMREERPAVVREVRPPAPARPERARVPVDLPLAVGPEAEAVATALQHLASVAGMKIEARILQAPEGLFVDLGGEGRARLVAEDAALLEALEQLLPRAVRGLHGAPIALSIDSGGVREQLLEDLRRLALETAARVRASGEPETLAEMNPAERRIVHLTLAEDPEIATESLGSGVVKRIQVRRR